jgi:hypothetical protein
MNLPTRVHLMSEMNNEPPKKSLSDPHPVDGGNKKSSLTSYNTLSRFESHPTAAIEEYQSFHHDWDSSFQCLVQYKEKYGVCKETIPHASEDCSFLLIYSIVLF